MQNQLLLGYRGRIQILPINDEFSVYDRFSATGKEGEIVFSANDKFWEWFGGMIQSPILGGAVHCYETAGSVCGSEFFKHFGSVEMMAIQIQHFYKMLYIEFLAGVVRLRSNGKANIFCIPDKDEIVRQVSAIWREFGWLIVAREVESSFVHGDDRLVFSSSLISEEE